VQSVLDSLRRWSVVVADSGDIDAVARYRPRDATTNPSLLLAAAQDPRYRHLLDADPDRLMVNFGREILRRIEGRVSTEVDARLSFDTEGSVAKAQKLISMYEALGVDRERVLIKIASTWEGIRAAARLEREGIRCNMTLLFSFAQAAACADAGVTLISPFVGRIYDWHKAARKVDDIPAEDDPGVASVARIWNYYKKFGYATQVMGASFRKTGQVLALAGCDLLTISPELLEQLAAASGEVERKLNPETAKAQPLQKIAMDEKTFRWEHNQDAMATEKLAEGIRRFHADLEKLKKVVAPLLASAAVLGAAGAALAADAGQVTVYETTPFPLVQMRVIKRLWIESWRSAFDTPTYRSAEQAAAAFQREAAARGGDAVVNFGCYRIGERADALKCNGTVVKTR